MKEYQSLVSELCPRTRFYDVDHRLPLTRGGWFLVPWARFPDCAPPPEWRTVRRRFPVNFICFKIYLFNKWITTRYTEELASNNFGWGPRNSRTNGVVECHVKLRNAISICKCMHCNPYLSDNASNSCFCSKELQQAQTGKELFAF